MTRLEVTLLVEDAVIGQPLLGVFRHQSPVVNETGDVEQAAQVALGVAQHQADALAGGADLLQGGRHALDQFRAQQQVLGGVAGQGQLREHDQVGAPLVPGLRHHGEDPVAVGGNVTHPEIDLSNEDTEDHAGNSS